MLRLERMGGFYDFIDLVFLRRVAFRARECA